MKIFFEKEFVSAKNIFTLIHDNFFFKLDSEVNKFSKTSKKLFHIEFLRQKIS